MTLNTYQPAVLARLPLSSPEWLSSTSSQRDYNLTINTASPQPRRQLLRRNMAGAEEQFKTNNDRVIVDNYASLQDAIKLARAPNTSPLLLSALPYPLPLYSFSSPSSYPFIPILPSPLLLCPSLPLFPPPSSPTSPPHCDTQRLMAAAEVPLCFGAGTFIGTDAWLHYRSSSVLLILLFR